MKDKWEDKSCISYEEYEIKKRMKSGNTIVLNLYADNFNKLYFNVYLCTYHKRKQEINNFLKRPGKDGVETLIWAKNKLIEFEDILRENYTKECYILVKWDDNKRRNVYERGLIKLGYKYDYIDGVKCLLKKIV